MEGFPSVQLLSSLPWWQRSHRRNNWQSWLHKIKKVLHGKKTKLKKTKKKKKSKWGEIIHREQQDQKSYLKLYLVIPIAQFVRAKKFGPSVESWLSCSVHFYMTEYYASWEKGKSSLANMDKSLLLKLVLVFF